MKSAFYFKRELLELKSKRHLKKNILQCPLSDG